MSEETYAPHEFEISPEAVCDYCGQAQADHNHVKRDTYNGWTNRETWAVALHINNDQGWQESVQEALRVARDDSGPIDEGRQFDSIHAGDIIRDNVEETLGYDAGTGDSPYSRAAFLAREDIGSMWRVNWTELGASFLDDISED